MTPTARLLSYVRRVRGRYLVGLSLTLGYAVSFQLVPLATRNVIQRIEQRAELEGVLYGVGLFVLAASAVAVFRLTSRLSLFQTARQIEYDVRNDLLAHLQRLPQSFFATHPTGDLMSRAVNDINNVRMFLGMGLMNIVQTPVLFATAIGVMLWLDPWVGLAVAAPYPLFVMIARIFGRRLHLASLATQEQLGALSTAVQENAAGALVVRSYAMADRERERFRGENQRLFRRQIKLVKVQAAMWPTISMLPAFGLLLLLVVGGVRVSSGDMAVSDVAAFFVYNQMLAFPTFMMGFVINLAQRGLASLQRLGEVLDVVPSIADHPDMADVDGVEGNVDIDGLEFAFPGRPPALRGVHLHVRAGQTIGLVGPVGSGKSTLVSAVPRLLELPDGVVRIDGIDVNRLSLRALRSSIAMVPQESFLFSTTVAENIRFGCPDAPMSEVREAARRAHILDEIQELPAGFDTPVGERGITLSGGQRQRLALARALILDPSILILDDSLSSVDAMAEESILKELRTARAGRTCFIVAHRLSAVRDADHILVLDQGAVVEEGSHEELLRKGGVYARIHRQQQLEAELEAED